MAEGRQDRIGRLYEEALALPADQRAGFLDQACVGDAQLRAELESLLKHDHHAGAGFLQPLPPAISTDDALNQTLAAPPSGPPAAHAQAARPGPARAAAAPPSPNADVVPAASPGATPSARPTGGHFPPIDGYEILRKLHQGGQGIVYQAVEKATKRKVAIKVLLEGPYASDQARKRFEREIELVAQLRHPNIISVFHSGVTPDGRQFCVMDYVRGIPLNTYVHEKKLPLEEALKLFMLVCDAVNYAHQKGVIHRDLKPSNILVDSDGLPRVLDFGLAKLVGGPEQTVVSMTGQVVGTLPYLSPEQARGNPDEIDTRTDVYALGVILYELLTGHYPYPVVGQMAEVLRHIASTEPTPPSRAWKADSGVPRSSSDKRNRSSWLWHRFSTGESAHSPIDDEVQTIVLRALTKERQRRYQGAGELARDIEHYLKNEPIEAKRDSAMYVLRKQLRRYRVPAAIAVGFVVFVVVAGTVSIGLYAKAEQALREAKLGMALSDARAAWRVGLAEVDQNEVRQFAEASFEAAREKAAEAEREGEAGRNERATALFNDAAAALQKASDAAATAKLNSRVAGIVTQFERALTNKARLDAERALAQLRALVPADGRLAAWREQARAIEWSKSVRVDLGDGVTIELLLIPAGSFTMGSSDEKDSGAQPPHEVTISTPFYLGKYEVTQAQWQAIMGKNPSRSKRGAARPVESVSWDDCQEFLAKLATQVPGLTFSLPTEAQWEYACRAGSKGAYCFGDDEGRLGDHAWYYKNSGGMAHDVGKKEPNDWGLYDMHGNVWEWCADRYAEYPGGAQIDPTGPSSGDDFRVLRGGGWFFTPGVCRSAARYWITPSYRSSYGGFRVVVAVSAGTP